MTPAIEPAAILSSAIPFLIISITLFLAAAAAIGIPLLLKRAKPKEKPHASRHGLNRASDQWRQDVAEVKSQFAQGEIDENEAYAQLAKIARAFASIRLGSDMSSKTLMDLNMHHQIGNKAHFDSLRQTISALYPAEFASPTSNRTAQETSVEAAATWVDSMIERWVA